MQGLHKSRRRALLSCDVSLDGQTVAAGTDLEGEDALILYWYGNSSLLANNANPFLCRDPRNPAAPLRAHESTHSDDITALHFSKSQNNLLLSASSDGLICTSNAVEDDEDEAGLHVGNVGSSVAQAGWMSEAGGSTSVWAASDMETFSIWSHEVKQISIP